MRVRLPLFLAGGALSVLVLIPLALKSRDTGIDVLQGYAFPACLLLAFCLRGRRSFQIPAAVPAFALFGWLGCLLYRDAAIETRAIVPRLEIAAASHDSLGIRSRSLQRNGAIVAQTYSIVSPALISKSFPSSLKAYEWLNARRDARLLVVGEEENWDLVFGRAGRDEDCEASCRASVPFAERYHVKLPDEAAAVDVPYFSKPLLLVQRPELVHVPAEPVELTAHALVWLSAGLRAAATSGPQSLGVQDALFEARTVLGQWRNVAPIAAASAISGTLVLTDQNLTPVEHQDAVSELFRALRLARKDYDPELYGMIVNNLAIAKFFVDGSADTLRSVKASLAEVSRLVSIDGRPTLAARTAMVNLELLDSARSLPTP